MAPNARSISPKVGVLMLDTRFPRPVGDIGNPASWPAGWTIVFRTVPGASARRVIHHRADGLLPGFLRAALELVEEGCELLTTSCGFMVRHQATLQARLPVPLVTSSMLLLPGLAKRTPGGPLVPSRTSASPTAGDGTRHRPARSCVLTFDADALDAACLRAAGGVRPAAIAGLEPGCHLQATILENCDSLDAEHARRDVVAATQRLVRLCPVPSDVVLECTNLGPYRDTVERETGARVHDIIDAVRRALHEAGSAPDPTRGRCRSQPPANPA